MVRAGLLSAFLLLSSGAALGSKPGPFDFSQAVRQVDYRKVSSGLLERDFHLLVRLPAGYDDAPESTYPVVYLLDGGATFPMLAGYLYYLRFEELVPAMIVVGISYGGETFEEGNYRSNDYTAPSIERDFWGGAGRFQQVLKQEIFPAIETNYRADPARRTLFGQSIGGQFVLFTALTQPSLFCGHIASNPALHRNLDFFLGDFSVQPASTRLYVASGSEDDLRFRAPALKWIEHWDARKVKPFALKAETLSGYGHFSIAPESFRRGLVWAFSAGDDSCQVLN